MIKFYTLSVSLICFFLLTVSCQKRVVELPLASQIEGKYVVSSFQWNGTKLTLPSKNQAGEEVTATLQITKKTESLIDLTLSLFTKKANNTTTQDVSNYPDLSLKTSETNQIDIYNSTQQKIGTVANGTLNLTLQDSQSKIVIEAKK